MARAASCGRSHGVGAGQRRPWGELAATGTVGWGGARSVPGAEPVVAGRDLRAVAGLGAGWNWSGTWLAGVEVAPRLWFRGRGCVIVRGSCMGLDRYGARTIQGGRGRMVGVYRPIWGLGGDR